MIRVVNECNKLKEIKGIKSLNTNQVTNMNSMFQDCHEIEFLDLSNFNISKVNDMGWMFNGCHIPLFRIFIFIKF